MDKKAIKQPTKWKIKWKRGQHEGTMETGISDPETAIDHCSAYQDEGGETEFWVEAYQPADVIILG